jgi:hypothetical protein
MILDSISDSYACNPYNDSYVSSLVCEFLGDFRGKTVKVFNS